MQGQLLLLSIAMALYMQYPLTQQRRYNALLFGDINTYIANVHKATVKINI